MSRTLALASREIQMGQITTVLEEAKPERHAAFEHETVAVVQRTESASDVGKHVIPFNGRCRYTVPRRLPSDLRPMGHWPTTPSNSSTVLRPAHAPPAIPPARKLVGSGFEVEVRGDGFDGRQCTRERCQFQRIGSEPSRRSAAAQLNRRPYSMTNSACRSSAAKTSASSPPPRDVCPLSEHGCAFRERLSGTETRNRMSIHEERKAA